MAKSSLSLRLLSAAVLAPAVLFCMIYGGAPFLFMIGAALYISVSEAWGMARHCPNSFVRAALYVLYILLCMAAFVYLRLHHPDGAGLALALMLCIWASDSGAYFAGKAIGGAKMAPTISPNKTWAGLFGGMAASAAAFALYAVFAGPFLSDVLAHDLRILSEEPLWLALAIGASITLSGQAGDLLISREKRCAGLKDTGNLIPGHGGLLDRIDSLLLAAPVFLATLKVCGL
jgi:phosphatidate cytidylyltransferase